MNALSHDIEGTALEVITVVLLLPLLSRFFAPSLLEYARDIPERPFVNIEKAEDDGGDS